ncbi:hypothetical protein B0H16DRAFT_1799491 [Mycena metata]|uniref:Uncharacterized protein n=1 Tax=Mycena metata TaxID=1033252 RepID=A0AAD7JGC0_9AGAR|nr:hypothetical protein B0H16DRAFT_1724294 [Mycena metata]KAJ7764204.1 hypothetical protein B0H16DRAFT_1799491 [Mycena metata]
MGRALVLAVDALLTIALQKLFPNVIRMFDVDQAAGKRVFVEVLKRDCCIIHWRTTPCHRSKDEGEAARTEPPALLASGERLARPAASAFRPLQWFPAQLLQERGQRSVALAGYPYDSHSRSRSRSPRSCSPKDRGRTLPEYRRRASRSRSPDHHRRKESRSRSRSSDYSDFHRRGRFKTKYTCTLSPAPPSKPENGREPEYYGPEQPPPPSSGVLKPPSKSSLASVGIRESIVARLARECAATRRDIADAATRGRLLE